LKGFTIIPSWKKPRSPPLDFDGPSENSTAYVEKLSGLDLASFKIRLASFRASSLLLVI
jgi:hypothetical protein